jgi:hypothetical protein
MDHFFSGVSGSTFFQRPAHVFLDDRNSAFYHLLYKRYNKSGSSALLVKK